MSKIITVVNLIGFTFCLTIFIVNRHVSAIESNSGADYIQEGVAVTMKTNTCTERCHVNYMAYDNTFKASKRVEMFRHKTHSPEQNLDCTTCHDKSEVNSDGHGRLTIKELNCLRCHHVELKETACDKCHDRIDERPMKYKEEKFVHGFTVKSDVDCGLCHVKDSYASVKDEDINCVKCHHTTPDLHCVKCHKSDLDKHLNTDPVRKKSLSWSVSFSHMQHPEQGVSCKTCHVVSHENNSGIVQYNFNCSKCHHDSERKGGCVGCHKEPLAYLRGEIGVKNITPMPDMMSRVVTCEDCHKYNDETLQFRGVEEYCVECHNEDYGKLYNAWRETITDRLAELGRHMQHFAEENDYAFLARSGIEEEKGNDMLAVEASGLDTVVNTTGTVVELITKYGIHNFPFTNILINSIEDKIR